MNVKLVLFYALFSMAAFVLFVFVLFPGKKVAAYLSRTVTMPNAMIQVHMEDADLFPPLRVFFENTRFSLGPDTTITPQTFSISLSLPAFFENDKNIGFQSKIFQGTANGSFRVARLDPLTVAEAQINISDIKVTQFFYQTALADITLSCEINGEYGFSGQENEKQQGMGTCVIRNVSAVMENSLFNKMNLPLVDFSQIEAAYTQTGNTITITNCIAKGSIVHIKLTGDIQIGFPLKESRLNLMGLVLPESPYLAVLADNAAIKAAVKNISRDGIKFGLSGTLMHPKIGI
jgi:type II secretion system protein N